MLRISHGDVLQVSGVGQRDEVNGVSEVAIRPTWLGADDNVDLVGLDIAEQSLVVRPPGVGTWEILSST